MSQEAPKPVDIVQAINTQRGCPHAVSKADNISTVPTEELTENQRKQEYYYLLDGVLPPVIDNVRGFRQNFASGIVKYDQDGETIVSGLADLEDRVQPFVQNGNFLLATYVVHDAVYRSIDIATEKWLRETDRNSQNYQRINALVDDNRQNLYGGIAVQKRVSSAANQTVLISCSFQRMAENLFEDETMQKITANDMKNIHAKSIRLAQPLTQLHLLETRFIREVLGSETFLGGKVQIYKNKEYFMLDEGMLKLQRNMVDKLGEYIETFPDERIGCPGAKYIPEIWSWLGELSEQYSYPALNQLSE